jgi:tyrosinase
LAYEGDQYEWLTNVRVKKHSFPASFFIHTFLGPFDPNPFSWSFEKNLVASHCIFIKPFDEESNNDLFVSATLPLTEPLLGHISNGTLKSLQPKDVMEFLNSNFEYRLTNMQRREIGKDQVPSLSISLVGAKLENPRASSGLPVWGEMVSYTEFSAG